MARPQGRQALGASSHERLWAVIDALVPDSSLSEATAFWMRVTFDSLREDAADPAKAFEVMARLAERQLPSPAVLNAWMHAVCDLRYTRKVWEARVRGWIDKAWEQGVRPDAGPAWGALRHVLAPMRVLQGSQSAQSLSWLVDAFASAPPSPQWMCVALAEVRFEHHEPARVAW